MSDFSKKKIERISKKMDIPIWKFKIAFGLPLKTIEATTLEEVCKCYCTASSGSEIEAVAFKKWNELSLKQAEDAIGLKEAEKAYENAPYGSEAEAVALRKIYEFS